jgi:hypothetical protein
MEKEYGWMADPHRRSRTPGRGEWGRLLNRVAHPAAALDGELALDSGAV